MTASICSEDHSAACGRRKRVAVSGLSSVAIKIACRKYASTAFREIRAHRTLEAAGVASCPHLTQMIEAFPHDGHVCIAFELHGRDMSCFIPPGGMDVAEVKHITRQVLQALDRMHGAGLIHTDLKPRNILYDSQSGIARLADLGLASATLTDGEEVATCDYTPPEGILGTPMYSAIDLWSLGCTVFKMLTGELLFDPWKACETKYEEFDPDEEDCSSGESTQAGETGGEHLHIKRGGMIGEKYQVLKKLGEGKFGAVWKAVALHSDPIKTPPANEFLAQARERLAQEIPAPPRPRWDLHEVTVAYEHLLQMVELLGPIPDSLTYGKWRSLFCGQTGGLRFDAHVNHRPLVKRLEARLPGRDAGLAAEFIGSLLHYDPAMRPTARQTLGMPWLH